MFPPAIAGGIVLFQKTVHLPRQGFVQARGVAHVRVSDHAVPVDHYHVRDAPNPVILIHLVIAVHHPCPQTLSLCKRRHILPTIFPHVHRQHHYILALILFREFVN